RKRTKQLLYFARYWERATMGIKRLKTFIDQRLSAANASRPLPEGASLLIDGNGWAFQLLRESGARMDLVGDYAALGQTARAAVTAMRDAGLQVGPVYFDGKQRRLKKATERHRAQQRQDQWAALQGWCLDGATPPEYIGFPPPPLIIEELEAVLRDLNVPVVDCPGEADQELAKAAAADAAGNHFVLGGDSDFFLFKGCRFIPFETLQLGGNNENLDGGGDGSPRTPTAQVWERARLAELCGVSETALVEWGLLLGNDYTAHLPLDSYAGLSGQARHTTGSLDRMEALDDLLRFLAERGDGYQLAPAAAAAGAAGAAAINPPVEECSDLGGSGASAGHGASGGKDDTPVAAADYVALALAFSRALYELQPLEGFPVDSPGRSPDGSPPVSYPATATRLLLGYEFVAMQAARAVCDAGDNDVDKYQAAALVAMASGARRPFPQEQRPDWEDVRVAWAYQKVLERFLSAMELPEAPSRCYDGATFHALAREERARAAVLGSAPTWEAQAAPDGGTGGDGGGNDSDQELWFEDLMSQDEIGGRRGTGFLGVPGGDAAALPSAGPRGSGSRGG
ncbi:unnamed protein product, partial [Phaeothamnion confervicola]